MKRIPALINRIATPFLVSAFLIGTAFPARPHDPFILRAALMDKPRMIFIALNTGLSVVYDGPGCGLYEAWAGLIQDGNATYDHQKGGNHGATYYPQGRILFKQSPGGELSEKFPPDTRPNRISPPNEAPVEVWSVTQSGQPVAVKPDYRGYTVDNTAETATLRYTLNLPAGQPIQVAETPEFAGSAGSVGMTRDFTVAGLASGGRLSLLLTGNPIRKADSTLLVEEWTATGDGKIEKVAGKAYFVAEAPGKTRVTGMWR